MNNRETAPPPSRSETNDQSGLSSIAANSERFVDGIVTRLINATSYAVVWPRPVKRGVVVIGDATICVIAIWLAFSLRLGEWRLFDWPVVRFALSVLIIWFPVAIYQRIYSAIFRYTGRGALVSLTVAVFVTMLPMIYFYMIKTYPGVPRTMAVLGPLMFLFGMAIARIVGRYILIDLFHSRPAAGTVEKRTLIYGAGSLGQRLAASLSAEKGMRLVGYIDDDRSKRHQRLDGRRVWHSSETAEAIERTGASYILLAMSDISRRRKREIIDSLVSHAIEVQALPPMRELIAGKVTISDLRTIDVEDLLGRSPVDPIQELLAKSITNKRVLITGAGGSIGSELCNQVVRLSPAQLILAEANEFALFSTQQKMEKVIAQLPPDERGKLTSRLINVTDRAAVDRLFCETHPETVFHAAAYKHVPLVEDNVLAGAQNNIIGTNNCAQAAQTAGVERFTLVSTDKAVRPPNVMGATKRVCEMILQAMVAKACEPPEMLSTRRTIFAMVRFGNVLGSSGSVVPYFREQIAAGGPVTVTHRDVTRYFMTIPEAAQLVVQATGMAEGGEVFVLDMGEPVRIWDLARSMIQLAGLTVQENDMGEGDIAIVERGLRPGEKLYEELLIDDDAQPTAHQRIMRAHEEFLDYGVLMNEIRMMQASIADNDADECRRILAGLVPSLSRYHDVSSANRVSNLRAVGSGFVQ